MKCFPTILLLFLAKPSANLAKTNLQTFDDSILYNINWPGSKPDSLPSDEDFISVTSINKEQYNCYLPKIDKEETNIKQKYEGPSALELISPLFLAKLPCSYRIDSYWTYEVCHGRKVRQFHESRVGKTVRTQEFLLGKWDDAKLEEMFKKSLNPDYDDDETSIPTKKIDGNVLPYYAISMGNGTLCDLNNNEPRQTTVLYVCYTHGKNEIYSVKETSICQYEVIILTPILCSHPKYKPEDNGNYQINCIPAEGSPNKPYNLYKLNKESRNLRRQATMDQIRVEFVPIDMNNQEEQLIKEPETPADSSPVQSFLSGRNCLVGGTGWWKYEFCYGKSVEQYHIEKDGSKTAINLGLFDKKKHLEWLANHPHKKPKPLMQRTQLSHFYSGGSVCDKTGKPRQTEVKLKCLDKTSSINTVSLYLLEPRYCEYILGVESPLICDILHRADEDGLVSSSAFDSELNINV